MNKSKIEWCDYSLNPVKGLCPMACPYCYARAMYKRFKWNPEIRFKHEYMWDMPSEPSKIFIGSTMELFGDWVKEEWLNYIFKMVMVNRQHTFIFLTKQPQNLINFSPFPENCWVGATLTLQTDDYGKQMGMNSFAALACLKEVKATIKFISFEPLLGQLGEGFKPTWWAEQFKEVGINWIIIGGQTKPYKPPKLEWVQEIEDAADKVNIPIFEKDNLVPLFTENEITTGLRQEFPNEK